MHQNKFQIYRERELTPHSQSNTCDEGFNIPVYKRNKQMIKKKKENNKNKSCLAKNQHAREKR